MRPKYGTRALVLSRTPLREAGMFITLLTSDLGLIRARAEGVRRPGAKLAHALQTFSESEVHLVRGKDGWRLVGAVLLDDWFAVLPRAARLRAARVSGLLQRLVQGEIQDVRLYDIVSTLIARLPLMPEEEADAAECYAALHILHVLGLDAGESLYPLYTDDGMTSTLPPEMRRELVLRINRGITASGL